MSDITTQAGVIPARSVQAIPGRPSCPRFPFGRLEPYLYLLPAVLTIIVWIYRPLVQAAQLSFYE